MPATVTEPTRALRSLVASLSLVALTLSASYAAIIVVLLPNQVAALDPAAKVTNLAIVSTVSFACTIIAQPLVGALSDKTSSRLGRRAPWALAGSLVAAAALLSLGHASSVLAIGALWVVAQFALNAVDIASSAVVPDEIPPPRRGRTLSLIGGASVLGGAIAVVVAGPRASAPERVYTALSLAILVACAVFALTSRRLEAGQDTRRDRPRGGLARQGSSPSRGRALVPAALVTLRAEPRFVHAFTSRFLFVLAYYLVYAYQLFILIDHLGLTTARANIVLVLLTVVSLVAVLVGVVVTGWWSDRAGNRTRFMVAACGLLAVALLIPLAFPTITGMTVFACFKGLAFGVHMVSSSALVTEVLPQGGATPGRDLGFYNVATNIPQTVAPAVAGLVIGHLGGYPALFVVASVVAALALVLGCRIGRAGDEQTSADSVLAASRRVDL